MAGQTNATNGTEQRLDDLIDEIRSLRQQLSEAPVAWRQAVDKLGDDLAAVRDRLAPTKAEPQDGERVELMEPHAVDPELMTPGGGQKPRRRK